MNKILSGVLIILILFSCKARQKRTNVQMSRQAKQILEKISSAEKDYRTFSGRSKIVIDNNGKTTGLGMSLRIRKDSVIWVSLNALAGIEVARALITPDSIKVLDRVNNKYIRHSFSYLKEVVKYDIDYQTLEAMLTGYTPPAFSGMNHDPSYSAAYLFAGTRDAIKYEFLYDDKLYRLQEVKMRDTVSSRNLKAAYEKFDETGGIALPYQVDISGAAGDEAFGLQINYNKITLNDALEYPFIVPKKYE